MRNLPVPLLATLVVWAGACLRAAANEPTFGHEVMAVLSKAGCNSGPCHGNQNGKGGFKLSLRGQDRKFDYLALARQNDARRIDPLSPEQSLMLLKATGKVAHQGGVRFPPAS